jgi:ribosomal protein L7/L12
MRQRQRRSAAMAGGESTRCYLDEAGLAEIDALLAQRKRIPAVRRVRELTGMSLVDAKQLVDSRRRTYGRT